MTSNVNWAGEFRKDLRALLDAYEIVGADCDQHDKQGGLNFVGASTDYGEGLTGQDFYNAVVAFRAIQAAANSGLGDLYKVKS